MKRTDFFKKLGVGAMAAVMAVSPVTGMTVFAATSNTDTNNTATANDLSDNDIIDRSKTGSLTIYKYDITAAEAAKEYNEGDRLANGQQDAELEGIMADYALEGVEFGYLRVGDIELYNKTAGGNSDIQVVYEIPPELAEILQLNEDDAFNMQEAGVTRPCDNEDVLHYTSTQLTDALDARLADDHLGTISALEDYAYNYKSQDVDSDDTWNNSFQHMPRTDENGMTTVDKLPLGLYMIVETDVPEQVTDLTDPFFASLPFTNITPEDEDATGTEGGDYWLYDMTVYPKNETGNPTLDKSVRNAYTSTNEINDDHNGSVDASAIAEGDRYDYNKNTGTGGLVVWNDDSNAGNKADNNVEDYVANRGGYVNDGITAGKGGAGYSVDFEYRDTQTASAGDVLDYILVSKLPRITAKGSFLSEYTFRDVLSSGITYNEDTRISFYDNAADARANNTTNAVTTWDLTTPQSGLASVTYEDVAGDAQRMTVKITEAGLITMNGSGTDGNNIAGQGNGQVSNNSYSDLYMVVSYTATVNSDKSLVLGDEGNPNDVTLTWSRTANSYYNMLEDRNYVYAYSLDLTKLFSDNQGDMSKVQFKLYNESDAYYVEAAFSEDDQVYYVTGKNVDKDSATTFTPNAEGKIIIYGLEGDTYGLTEIATDNGYTLLEDAVHIDIVETDREINAAVAGVTGMDAEAMEEIVANYGGGIFDENGNSVLGSHDYIQNTDGNRPAQEDPNGNDIGKMDMFVGEIKPATATVDQVDAEMQPQDDSDNATVAMQVTNHKNFRLPQTGGFGTLAFVLGGCAAALGGVVLVTKKGKKKDVN